jgi:hypothetical protein
VWTQHRLSITRKKRLEYLEHFLAIDNHIQDIQSSGVVHDIIDPNLFPRYFPDNSRAAILNRISDRIQFRKSDYLWNSNGEINFDRTFARGIGQLRIPIREHYHWVPSDIRIEASGKVRFLSPIQGLDDRFQLKTQEICQNIFSAMMPLFAQSGLLQLGQTGDLQVIVKVQRYVLQPMTSYTGKWHVEGLTENIVFGGVYYLDQDLELEGGGLKFRNSGCPNNDYHFSDDITRLDFEAKVAANTAIVFANTIPHRLITLKNTSVIHTQSRTFINFFVISPNKPLPSTAQYGNSMSIAEAKRRRQEHRDQMSIPDFKHGFAKIQWGNTGTLEYLDHATRVGLQEHFSIYSNSS